MLSILYISAQVKPKLKKKQKKTQISYKSFSGKGLRQIGGAGFWQKKTDSSGLGEYLTLDAIATLLLSVPRKEYC